jgi:hypothetical protein
VIHRRHERRRRCVRRREVVGEAQARIMRHRRRPDHASKIPARSN